MTNRLIVNIFLLTLITITCYSQQAESVVTEDLSLLYLNWKFKHNRDSSSVNNLQTVHGTPAFFTATIDNTSTIRESCDAFIYEFAKQASQFIECSIDNARPFRFCEGCVVHYMKAKTVYNDIKVNDEKKNNCHKWLLDSDRVQVINTVYFDFEQIWNSADCDKCFDSISETQNGTVQISLRQTTKTFLDLYKNFTGCVPRNIINTMNKTFQHNATICTDCAHYYNKMNSMFNQLLNDQSSPQHVCMDIVDMMNYTRLLWGDILQCTKFEKQYAPVVVLGVILLFIPLLFYIFMKIYGTRKEKEIIRQKRLSIFNRDSSFNYGASHPDSENSYQDSVHHSNNTGDGPMRQRTNITQQSDLHGSSNARNT